MGQGGRDRWRSGFSTPAVVGWIPARGGELSVRGVRLRNLQTNDTWEKECQGVFMAIGHTPNTQLFEGMLEMDESGYLITEPDSTATDIPGVFACGDAKDHVYRQAVNAAGTGRTAQHEAVRLLSPMHILRRRRHDRRRPPW
mgnify:CR=1 FL=1